jgi:hypothetical protein
MMYRIYRVRARSSYVMCNVSRETSGSWRQAPIYTQAFLDATGVLSQGPSLRTDNSLLEIE